jgi:ferric-dicitrate binding protein FerR (iron transport regulator)
MPDEIDVLRTFRSDTPEPDAAAWAAARAAIASAAEPSRPQRHSSRLRFRLQRRTAVIAGGIAVAAAVTAGVIVSVLPGSSGLGPAPTLHKALTSAWEPARALRRGRSPPRRRPGSGS